MAKKEETISLLDTFQEFKESKNIDRTTMISVYFLFITKHATANDWNNLHLLGLLFCI